MAHNMIGLLQFNGEVKEYANTNGGGGGISPSELLQVSDNIAPKQATNTASELIPAGKYFVNSEGKLCQCDVQIASGGNIVVGSNCHLIPDGGINELNSNIGNFSHLSPIGYADSIIYLYFMISLPSNQTISLTSAKVWNGTEWVDINLTNHPLVLDYRIGWNCKFYFSNYIMNNRQATMLDLQGSIIRI